MPHNGFTLVEVLISLSLLGMVMVGGFATQREYQVLAIQTHHVQEQQEQFTQLREIIENYAPAARSSPCPPCAVMSAIYSWRKALPKYMSSTPTRSGTNQLNIELCSAKPTHCINEKIVV